jgi:hypothetical protein
MFYIKYIYLLLLCAGETGLNYSISLTYTAISIAVGILLAETVLKFTVPGLSSLLSVQRYSGAFHQLHPDFIFQDDKVLLLLLYFIIIIIIELIRFGKENFFQKDACLILSSSPTPLTASGRTTSTVIGIFTCRLLAPARPSRALPWFLRSVYSLRSPFY